MAKGRKSAGDPMAELWERAREVQDLLLDAAERARRGGGDRPELLGDVEVLAARALAVASERAARVAEVGADVVAAAAAQLDAFSRAVDPDAGPAAPRGRRRRREADAPLAAVPVSAPRPRRKAPATTEATTVKAAPVEEAPPLKKASRRRRSG